MGVPKFFRFISERYPCLSELVREYQIPEFDNMYLDMNGIIHMCSHPDDNNPHFRITEEKIIQDIFHYLEVLFRMIRPQKLFFMAIDGVAPRAKMNQQRGRRFRSAKDAAKQEDEAKKKGEVLPTEARFDSNCITPGTVFMARLHEQLKYFVVDKISNDSLWRDCKIVLSGHETPGEGEHKIMDYIRYIRAQPGYDPNTRHCLYGLDADLIMLGLCTHEPHFSLLREEVKFGRKSTKRQSVPEEITFFLLHLSLMREYLELEFTPVKDKLVGFKYDFEKIIDDWVLMGFLVGNDFIPHLPNLHIANGALPFLYQAYMEVLPTLDGYINEAGSLNLARFEKFMQKLGNIDVENFEEIRDDLLYMEAKTGRRCNAHSKVSSGKDLEKWAADPADKNNVPLESLEPEKLQQMSKDSGLAALIKEAEDMCLEASDQEEEEDEEDDLAFENYKKDYYRDKLEYANVTAEIMRDQAEGYVRAIQWNLNYYYNGVCSWSWYYPHHYAPYISDIKGFSDLKIDFELGTPFKPYEQLLAVLPAASKNLLPGVYHELMTGENSLISKYYPEDFQTDLNGKRQDWEAVVLIPFMDENLLLEAMKPCYERLTSEEKKRNTHGPMLAYTYTDEDFGQYEAPQYFPTVKHNHSKLETISIENLRVPKEKLVKGAYPGVTMDVYYPGFPTMKHLNYTAELRKAKVKVFEQPSRNENMIISIIPEEKLSGDNIPVDLLGTTVFVGWPHLIEARVAAISNSKMKYISMGGSNQYNTEEKKYGSLFKDESAGIIERYKNRLGIEVGEVKVLAHVQVMIGRKYIFSANGRLTLEKQFSENTANYPLQTIVFNIAAYDSYHSVHRNILDVFPEGATCFTLCNPYYGSQGLVMDCKDALKMGRMKVCLSVTDEPDFTEVKNLQAEIIRSYKTLYNVSSQLGMSHILFTRITGSIYVSVRDGEGGLKNVNVGLDLKFNKKNKETPGFTRKIASTWYYTDKCAELIREYSEKFPDIFMYFSQNLTNDNISGESIFGDSCDEKIKELQQWLRSLPTHSMDRQICGSQVTDPEVVKEIEKVVDSFPKNMNAKKVVMKMKPSSLYKPEVQSGTLVPDPKMNVKIFDRVVNARKGFSVPFGLKGTVTAITESTTKSDRDTMYDIVFDKSFKDGMTLNCSTDRGYRLPKTAFINISYGKRLLEEKTGKPGSLMAMAESASKQQSYQQNGNTQNKFFNQFVHDYNPGQQNQRHHKGYGGQDQYKDPSQSSPQFDHQNSAFASFNRPGRQYNSPSYSNEGNTPSPRGTNEFSARSSYPMPQSQKDGGVDKVEYAEKVQLLLNDTPALFRPQEIPKKNKELQKEEVLESSAVGNNGTSSKSQRAKVDTDYLKTLLRIGSPPTNKTEKKESVDNKVTPPILLQNSTNNRSSNISFETLAQAAQAPASVRLLTYYQSNGLGIPRYQYFPTDKLFRAQISLTKDDLVMGDPGNTKEEAAENVASKVLQILIKKGKTTVTTEPSENFPIPPKTWVQPQKAKQETGNNSTDTNEVSKTGLNVVSTPFVPLQAIKRQKSRTSSGGNTSLEQNGEKIGSVEKAGNSQDEQKEILAKEHKNVGHKKNNSQQIDNQEKPKKQRKPRIAANFLKKE